MFMIIYVSRHYIINVVSQLFHKQILEDIGFSYKTENHMVIAIPAVPDG